MNSSQIPRTYAEGVGGAVNIRPAKPKVPAKPNSKQKRGRPTDKNPSIKRKIKVNYASARKYEEATATFHRCDDQPASQALHNPCNSMLDFDA